MSANEISVSVPYFSSSDEQVKLNGNERRRIDNGAASAVNAYAQTALLVGLLFIAVMFMTFTISGNNGRSVSSTNDVTTAAPVRALQAVTATAADTDTDVIFYQIQIPATATSAAVTVQQKVKSAKWGIRHPTSIDGESSSTSFTELVFVVNVNDKINQLIQATESGTAITQLSLAYITAADATGLTAASEWSAVEAQSHIVNNFDINALFTAVEFNTDGTATFTLSYARFTTAFYTPGSTAAPITSGWNRVENKNDITTATIP